MTVLDFIERGYNPRRRHSALGYRSPPDYEHDVQPAFDRIVSRTQKILDQQ